MRAAFYPAATVELLPAAEYGPAYAPGEPIGVVLHVNAGYGDPYGWWIEEINTNPASAQWQVMKTGEVRQEVPADHQSWHNVAGIPFWHGLETEGEPWEPLTAQQVLAIAHLYVWGHEEWGWPLICSESPWQGGFGWHGMGGAAWGGHYGCPGDLRKAQRQSILVSAAQMLGKPISGGHALSHEPVIRLGDIGPAVSDFQRVCNALGLRDNGSLLVVDGIFGQATLRVVLAVQRFFHAIPDGIVGPVTWGIMSTCLARKGITRW